VHGQPGGFEARTEACKQGALEDTGVEAVLAHDLSLVGDVRHVLTERADGSLLVWIALDNPAQEVREEVFQRELGLIDSFPEVEFDFNIVPAMGRDPDHIASGAKVVYTRKEDNLAKQG
jgi:hypothetical protein